MTAREPGLPAPAWHYVTWLAHFGIQGAVEIALMAAGADPRLGVLTLPFWVGREVRDLRKKHAAQGGRLYWWDWLDALGDLAGPAAVIFYVWR